MIEEKIKKQKKIYYDIMKILQSDPDNRVPLAVACLSGAYAVELVCRGAINTELRKGILRMINNSLDNAELHFNKVEEGKEND